MGLVSSFQLFRVVFSLYSSNVQHFLATLGTMQLAEVGRRPGGKLSQLRFNIDNHVRAAMADTCDADLVCLCLV